MSAVLEVERLSYRYPAGPLALHEVSLTVGPGEIVVLAGASGSGKSTLLRAAAGLVPHFHGGELAGRVRVAGRDTREHGPAALSRVVGTVLQDPETQLVMGTVRAELGFAAENRGESPTVVGRAVEETALALGVAHLLDRSTAELSGGEMQRVALGAALTARPPLLVLDEPTSQLDPVAGDELIGLLRRLAEDFDVAVLIAEHRLERCLPAADRAVAMAAGRIAYDGTPDGLLDHAVLAAPALATPGAVLLHRLGLPPVAGVRRARAALRAARRPAEAAPDPPARSGGDERPVVLRFRRAWHELRAGPAILRAVDLELRAGERVALMGRNGAGKSTLLRHAAGLAAPTRGRVERPAGRVALLLQHPGDYLVHDSVGAEAPDAARRHAGVPDDLAGRHPRELSGGQRQRLALAVVIGDGPAPDVLALDEPTRGMDRDDRLVLARLLRETSAAVLVATHDPEFAALFAERVVLLADGAPIADGPVREVLAGGTYFATETARIVPGALRPEDVAVASPVREGVPA